MDINTLSNNQIEVISALIHSLFALMTILLGAAFAFEQLRIQFKHKIVYEGWKDFQSKIFSFSNDFSTYIVKILGLRYGYTDSLKNTLGIDIGKYKFEKWQDIQKSFHDLELSYIAFLSSFEANEFIFISLINMKSIFISEYKEKVEQSHNTLMEIVFPEVHGQHKGIEDNLDDVNAAILKHYDDAGMVSIYLDDFRVALQNHTIGKVIDVKVKNRKPVDGYSILKTEGLVVQRNIYVALLTKINIMIKKVGLQSG